MHQALLTQALSLARLDPKKPKQANLRRAVSSCYYAVFHLLVDEACRLPFGTQPGEARFRQVIGRAFDHSTMKEACRTFSGGTLKGAILRGLPSGFSVAVETQRVAMTFVELQEKRHLADYDLTVRFRRSDVLGMIENAIDGAQEFLALPRSNEKSFFLCCLWAWKGLARR